MSMPQDRRRFIVLAAMLVLPVVIVLVLAHAGGHPAMVPSVVAEAARNALTAAATISGR